MARTPVNVERLSARVLLLFREADRAARKFGRRAGIACPAGCGDCCRDDRPEASPLSLLPLALHVVRLNGAEELLERTENPPDRPCIFYTPDPLAGHCTVYPLRPLLCRLFGFAGRRDKHGNIEFRSCRRMAPPPAPCPRPPLFSTWHMRLEVIYPPLAEILPLPQAMRRALLWVLLHQALRPPRMRGTRAA